MVFYADSLNAILVSKIKLNGGSVNKASSKVSILNNFVMLVGGTCGALAAKNNLGVPFLLGGMSSIAAAIFCFLQVGEGELPEHEQKMGIIKSTVLGFKEVFAHRTLLILMAMMLVVSINGQIFAKMFNPLIRPLVPTQMSMSWVWAILMTGSILGGFVSYCTKTRKLKSLIIIFQLLHAVPLILCAIIPQLFTKVGLLTGFELIHTGIKPIMNTKKNECINDLNRATVLSAFATLASIGSMIGLLTGILADHTSISFTWIFVGSNTTLGSIILASFYLHTKSPN